MWHMWPAKRMFPLRLCDTFLPRITRKTSDGLMSGVLNTLVLPLDPGLNPGDGIIQMWGVVAPHQDSRRLALFCVSGSACQVLGVLLDLDVTEVPQEPLVSEILLSMESTVSEWFLSDRRSRSMKSAEGFSGFSASTRCFTRGWKECTGLRCFWWLQWATEVLFVLFMVVISEGLRWFPGCLCVVFYVFTA